MKVWSSYESSCSLFLAMVAKCYDCHDSLDPVNDLRYQSYRDSLKRCFALLFISNLIILQHSFQYQLKLLCSMSFYLEPVVLCQVCYTFVHAWVMPNNSSNPPYWLKRVRKSTVVKVSDPLQAVKHHFPINVPHPHMAFCIYKRADLLESFYMGIQLDIPLGAFA